ncbi:copper resistance CopC family protein [Paenibacillus agaridevorans]|uniref:copper resistance CopC family protein n=1 Tax=Paenibacillus agaridevorans TaxID=171404 RepID=UPI001BE497C5|nr:copper resistance protein CopC [Paenibacillus agaridevorans]
MRMLYIFTIVSLLTGAAMSAPVYAHTSLDDSYPEANTIMTEELEEIVLEFNSEVAPLSTLEVINSDGGIIPIDTGSKVKGGGS